MRKYLYGIISTSKPAIFGQSPLSSSSEGVYTIIYRDLAGVVSDYTVGDFSSVNREGRLHYLMAHLGVIEQVMAGGYTILPVKFGTFVENEDEIRHILEQGYKKLDQTLDKMYGMVEIDVIATWNLKKVFEEIRNGEEIMQLKRSIAGKSASQIQQMTVSISKLAKEALDRRRQGYLKQTIQSLADEAIDIQPKPVVTDEIMMSIAFLIQRGKQQNFDGQIRRINEAFGEQFNFRIIGPLPPYSFSTVEIERINPARIEEARQLLGLGTHISDKELREAYCYLAAKSHLCMHLSNEIGGEHFATVREAFILLRDYCYRQNGHVRYNLYNRHYSLLPEAVSRAFTIDIRRPALQTTE